jgi:hypothetical protein
MASVSELVLSHLPSPELVLVAVLVHGLFTEGVPLPGSMEVSVWPIHISGDNGTFFLSTAASRISSEVYSVQQQQRNCREATTKAKLKSADEGGTRSKKSHGGFYVAFIGTQRALGR